MIIIIKQRHPSRDLASNWSGQETAQLLDMVQKRAWQTASGKQCWDFADVAEHLG